MSKNWEKKTVCNLSRITNLVQVWFWSTMWPYYVIILKTRSWEYFYCCKFGTIDAGLFEDKMCLIFKDREKWESWQRLQNCVKSPTHLSMWMQPRQLTPCDMLFFPAKWLYFSHSKLTRRPWHWRFEMVKMREESERDQAHSVCFAFRATVALQLRDAEKRKREEERNWEVLRKW